jgi:hypothetical protein
MVMSGMGQDELADVLIQREAVDAVAGGQHHHGRRAVKGITGGHLLGAGLQEVAHGGLFDAARAAQDGEDGADGDVDVDVGGAVERVEGDQVLAARILAGIW